MKIALIADPHYGIRNDNIVFIDNMKKFLDETFFPYIHKENIQTVICLGDLLDRRKYVNYYTASRLRNDFIEPMIQKKIQFHWILGNHDIYWREQNDVSAASELYQYLPYHSDFTIHKNAKEIEFLYQSKILLVPWICKQNREQTLETINNSDAKICLGHLELQGFEMYKGMVVDHGDDPQLFQKFALTCSGHYHHKSNRDNIHYLGACAEFTWSDYNDPRGFHILDCDNLSLHFIQNPNTIFQKIFYNDVRSDHRHLDFGRLRGKIVKVIVQSRTNSDEYNTFMSQVEAAQPLELQTVEDHLHANLVSNNDLVSETKDTLQILREYVAQTNNTVNSAELDSLIVELYNEAQSVE